MTIRKNLYLLLITFCLISGCSSQKDTFTNRLYHNITAKFNAYFLAKEKINEVERNIIADHHEDYTQVLPVFYPIDSATIENNEALLEEARELASKAIDWHRISHWVDDSYFLIGKIEYYEAKTDDAINTFKYINVNGKDNNVRHLALIQLLRTFIDHRKFDDAAYVIDFLSKEKEISKENKQYLYQTLAYYYEVREEKGGLIAALERTLANTSSGKEKSRIYFTLAQLYQREGFDAQAYSYYLEALKGNPPYERTFFAQLYAQQVAELKKSKDFKKVRSYYDGLYKDRKNRDLRDVVVYEKALFELNQNETEEGLRLLQKAAREQGSNPKQKGYIYQKLAEVHFEQKEDFVRTKYYLDSALQYFKESDKAFEPLSSQKEIMDQYVANYNLIQNNDSLLALSRLSPEEQSLIAENFIKQEEERLINEAKKATEQKSTGIFDNLLAFGDRGGSSSFYFDNPMAVQRGAIDFYRNWGNRPLADNWRRGANGGALELDSASDMTEISDNDNTVEDSASSDIILPDKNDLLNNIPKDEVSIAKLHKELESAYFEMGKILFFDLKRPNSGREYLQLLIDKYPETGMKPEAYYTLFLIEKEINGSPSRYAALLNQEFPNSPFTKSINNPNNQTSKKQDNLVAAARYREAYELYKNREYEKSREIIRATQDLYPITQVSDKLNLLDIMISGKMENEEVYKERLEKYISTTKDAGLSKMARNMLRALTGEPEQELISEEDEQSMEQDSTALASNAAEEIVGEEEEATPSPYELEKGQTHIFILVMTNEASSESKSLTGELEGFHNENFSNSRLRTGSLSFDREHAIIIVSPFSNANKAMEYRQKFLTEFKGSALPEELKKSSFVISIKNFQQLNKRKDIPEYEAFFQASYIENNE